MNTKKNSTKKKNTKKKSKKKKARVIAKESSISNKFCKIKRKSLKMSINFIRICSKKSIPTATHASLIKTVKCHSWKLRSRTSMNKSRKSKALFVKNRTLSSKRQLKSTICALNWLKGIIKLKKYNHWKSNLLKNRASYYRINKVFMKS